MGLSPLSHQLIETEVFGATTVVAIRGDVDLAERRVMTVALLNAVDRSASVLVDLCKCKFMDSQGIGALIAAYRRADQQGVALAICCLPSGAPERVLRITLKELIPVFPDRESGLQFLALP